MDVSIYTSDWYPEIFHGKENLLLDVAGFVNGELDHAEFCFAGWRVFIPGEVWLRRMGLRELLHLVIGFLVEDEGKIERFGYGLVGNVVVPGMY